MDRFFIAFQVMFIIMTIVAVGVFLFILIIGITRWNKNNNSPRLTIDATVVSKRTHISHHHGTAGHCDTFTNYYVTFQVDSGDRMELAVGSQNFGMLVEGDTGKLTFQGTRYISFDRITTARRFY